VCVCVCVSVTFLLGGLFDALISKQVSAGIFVIARLTALRNDKIIVSSTETTNTEKL
jgi:hypothetical protein